MHSMWVYSGAGGTVNATAIVLANGQQLVVDTGGNAEDGAKFAEQVSERGSLGFLFNTHEHGDHLGGNQLFACPIVSSLPAMQEIAAMLGQKGVPTVAFSDRLQVNMGEPVVMQLMGGHCPGLAVLFLPERKLLFTGDLVFNGRMPWMGQADFALWTANLDELLQWDVETVVPGHGAVGGKEILAAQRDFLIGFVEQVQQAARAGQTKQQIQQLVSSQMAVPDRWQQMLERAISLAIEA